MKTVYSIKTDKTGKTYIADGSLIIFDGIHWNYYYPNSNMNHKVTQFTIDALYHVWTLQDVDTLTEFDGISWHNYIAPMGITDNNMYLYSISSDSINNILLGFESENNLGLLKFNGNNWTNYNTSNSAIKTNRISSLMPSKELLYIGTNGKEINTLNNINDFSIISTSNSPLVSNSSETVYQDNFGNIWTSSTSVDNITQLAKFNGLDWIVIDSVPTGVANSIAIDYHYCPL